MHSQHAFSANEQAAGYRAIFERRDIRRFRADKIPEEVLGRLLHAGVSAPSVSYMQPLLIYAWVIPMNSPPNPNSKPKAGCQHWHWINFYFKTAGGRND